MTSRIDVNNFIDYFATELYFANWDWPKNNHRVWRSNQESGKYRWMFYDCDACFYRFSLDQISQLKDTDEKVQLPLVLLKNLLANSAFKSLFHSRYVELISNEFSAPRFIDKIDSLEQLYEPLLLDHIQRWSQPASRRRCQRLCRQGVVGWSTHRVPRPRSTVRWHETKRPRPRGCQRGNLRVLRDAVHRHELVARGTSPMTRRDRRRRLVARPHRRSPRTLPQEVLIVRWLRRSPRRVRRCPRRSARS